MGFELDPLRQRGDIGDKNFAVVTSRCDPLTVGTEVDRTDKIGMVG